MRGLKSLKEYIRPSYATVLFPFGFFLFVFIVCISDIRTALLAGLFIGGLLFLLSLPVWTNYLFFLFDLATEHRSSVFREELAEDFRTSRSFLSDRLRVGKKYVYSHGRGQILSKEDLTGIRYEKRTVKGSTYWDILCYYPYNDTVKLAECSGRYSESEIQKMVDEVYHYLREGERED